MDLDCDRSISLRCCVPETNTDKDYLLNLVEVEGGWGVRALWGKHGSILKPTMKTNKPLTWAAASAEFDKILRGQLAKGYVATGQEAGVVVVPEKVSSGIHCQLLNPIEQDDVEAYLADTAWAAQWKADGQRILLHKTADGELRVINRKGQLIPGPQDLLDAAADLPDDVIIDGEWVGASENISGQFVAFDILLDAGVDLRSMAFETRIQHLKNVTHELRDRLYVEKPSSCDVIQTIYTAFNEKDKRALLEKVQEEEGEGIVFKRLDATVSAGKNHRDQVKFKLWNSCSAIVKAVNNRRSVALKILNADGGETGIGNVTIPANHDIPAVGQVVEVRYLYGYKGGSLYQPTYNGVRTDIDPSECLDTQLSYVKESSRGHQP